MVSCESMAVQVATGASEGKIIYFARRGAEGGKGPSVRPAPSGTTARQATKLQAPTSREAPKGNVSREAGEGDEVSRSGELEVGSKVSFDDLPHLFPLPLGLSSPTTFTEIFKPSQGSSLFSVAGVILFSIVQLANPPAPTKPLGPAAGKRKMNRNPRPTGRQKKLAVAAVTGGGSKKNLPFLLDQPFAPQ
jgi:hypothetical protein